MSELVFVDTNIWLYLWDTRATRKSVRADDVIPELAAAGRLVSSTQVLQELYAAATQKLRVSPEIARARVEQISQQFTVVVVQPHLILGAIDIQRLHRISFWDALVVRCASAASCQTLLTEDLNHGQTIEGVTIVNPFLDAQHAGESRGRYTPTLRGPSKRARPRRIPESLSRASRQRQ